MLEMCPIIGKKLFSKANGMLPLAESLTNNKEVGYLNYDHLDTSIQQPLLVVSVDLVIRYNFVDVCDGANEGEASPFKFR
jgi:hypothetical protein